MPDKKLSNEIHSCKLEENCHRNVQYLREIYGQGDKVT